jgi:predicted ATPase
MMTRLRIQNFKAWRDTGDLRLAPITVFFGSNSSGKSSLLQFLLMLRQTVESPDRRRVLHLGKSTPVELGAYRDLLYQHDLARNIKFELEWTLPRPLEIRDPLLPSYRFSASAVAFSAEIATDDKGTQQQVRSLRYRLRNGQTLVVHMSAQENGGRKYALEADSYKLVRNPGPVWPLPPPVRFYGFPDEVGVHYQNGRFTSDLALAFEQQLKRIQYVGPLRGNPERLYLWSGEVPEHVGWAGQRAIAALLAARDRSISQGLKKRSRPFPVVIAEWLKEIGLLDQFEVREVGRRRKEYEVWVRTKDSDQAVNLPDVGFGVSQVLPIVVQCFYATPHTTVLLEQPEIHLHPRVQTALADMFIAAVQAREDGQDRSVQIVAESHSEHFLRRLQRRVAEGTVKPEEVALYFCEAGTDGATAHPLKVNQTGDIENWPDDFFGDEMGELAARMEAAARREPTGP